MSFVLGGISSQNTNIADYFTSMKNILNQIVFYVFYPNRIYESRRNEREYQNIHATEMWKFFWGNKMELGSCCELKVRQIELRDKDICERDE